MRTHPRFDSKCFLSLRDEFCARKLFGCRAGDFKSYCFWEPVHVEVGGREQKMVYITVERRSGEHVLAAYGLCRSAPPTSAGLDAGLG